MYLSFTHAASRIMISLITPMKIIINTAVKYQTPRENGFKKISSLILLVELDINKKQGLYEKQDIICERDVNSLLIRFWI